MQSENQRNQDPWRRCLADFLRKDHELVQLLAERLMVKEVTIWRWANAENSPHQLFRTLDVLAHTLLEPDRELFVRAIWQQYPEWQISAVVDDSPIKPLPSIYYSKLIQAARETNDALAFWSIVSLLSQQLSSHLDPDFSAGLALSICLCTPPKASEHIASLYIPEQPNDHPLFLLRPFPLLLGLETSVSWALTSREAVVFSSDEIAYLREAQVRSAAAQAIQRRGKVSGCLVVTSHKPDYFTKPRLGIFAEFATLAMLALDEAQFYAPDQIALSLFPSIERQQERENQYSFRERMRDLRRVHSTINQRELETLTLQDLEAELRLNESALIKKG